MIALTDMDTIQLEITNRCINNCANCTRFVGLVKKPFFMDFNIFKKAVDSMVDYPAMTGFQGGDPLLHPEFEKMCDYALSKIPKEQLGLWTCFPRGHEKYREVICRTFGYIFLNDHSRNDIYHHPFLVATRDYIPSKDKLYAMVDKCHFQRSWSASINPKGAYFCEMAASFAMLYDLSFGWEVEKGWWNRTPKDYTSQIQEFCQYCGGALFLKRRPSVDTITDISITNLDKFKKHGINIDNCEMYNHGLITEDSQEELASYKDQGYRNLIAMRYGIYLSVNERGFNEPYLLRNAFDSENLLSRYRRRYA